MVPRWADRLTHALELRRAALTAADPAEAVRQHLQYDAGAGEIVAGEERIRLGPEGRVYVVGAGKAGAAMAQAARALLGPRLATGCVAVPDLPGFDLAPVELIRAGHPMPDPGSLAAGRRIADLLAGTRPFDVVIALLSGGGSALLELPANGVTLADLRATTQALLRSGATIGEFNCVRKRLSQIKGGGLARLAAPATVIALIFSDVVGDPLDVIASGPTVPDASPPGEALAVIERYGLAQSVPASVIGSLRSSREAVRLQPVGVQYPATYNLIIGSNTLAAEAAVECASALGFGALLLTSFVEGEAREVGRVVAGLAKGVRRSGHPLPAPACLVLGGETTVAVCGSGAGGRNQELALAAAIALEGWERVLVMTLATDGVDGPTPAAGAIVTGETVARAKALGLSPAAALAANDSYTFFAALGDAILLGPTGTNVNDLTLICVY